MLTAVAGIAALVVWLAFELALRAPGAASAVRPGAGDRASTPLLVAACAVAAILPVLLRPVDIGRVDQAAWAGVVVFAAGQAVRAWGMRFGDEHRACAAGTAWLIPGIY